ncbi:MAG TPA: hypothetical protein VEW74_05310 [Candidatus Nitrosotalea sp.]|nr:hypothetical protein [Candidatus Nitrosotalea sp.]
MVTTPRFFMRSLFWVTAAAAAAALAACAGSQPGVNPTFSTQTSQAQNVRTPIGDDTCRSQGGVRATPCRVQLTTSNPGPIAVTLRTPHGAKGSLVEHDNCGGAAGIAVITGSGNSWSVTAGAKSGSCKARFNYFNNGQKVGWARIKIQNQV